MSDGVKRKSTNSSSGYPNRKKANSKRPLNRYEVETPKPESVSTSAQKLQRLSVKEIEVDESFGYRFINFVQFFNCLSAVIVCKDCHSPIKFSEGAKRGLGFKVIVKCEHCEETLIPNSPFIDHAYDINRRIILVMRLLGIGLNGIERFCSIMDLPRPVFHSYYDKICTLICGTAQNWCEVIMKKAANEEKAKTLEKKLDGVTVSGDGSWRKRGFSSLYGFISLIGWLTGKVLDVVIKSKYCKSCEYWEPKKDTEEYKVWAENHEEECQSNHTGSAGKMEVDGVIEMFERSEGFSGISYLNYVGDGDSKTFKNLQEKLVLNNREVHKKECIDHVKKRMGTRLRNLKKVTKGLGGKGKLTGKLIDELTIYYGLAIRRNHDSVTKMRDAVWATLWHKMSTDTFPTHDHCPTGEDSWCDWQVAKAQNKLHEYIHKEPIQDLVYEAVKPVYEDLTKPELLHRCLGGYTQNSNESFNAFVWSFAPKAKSSGKVILDTAVYLSVGLYNEGWTSVMQLMELLGLTIGPNCYNYCMEADATRIKLSERSLSDQARESRISIRSSRKESEEMDASTEGEMYGAGIAD